MQRRLIIAAIAALVYASTYAILLTSQGEVVSYQELAMGTILFFIAFFFVRSWLDGYKERRENEQYDNQKNNQKDLPS